MAGIVTRSICKYLVDQYVDRITVFGKWKPKIGHNLVISHDEKALE